jgi:acetyl esterase/lipase
MRKPSSSAAVILVIVVASLAYLHHRQRGPRPQTAKGVVDCSMGRFQTPEELRIAKETGLQLDERSGCLIVPDLGITTAPATVTAAAAPAPATAGSLADARRGFVTTIAVRSPRPAELPNPPATLFVRADYANDKGATLAAYVTPDPRDGRRHPAIIWLTGGETNSLDDFWTPGPEANDQSASAFRNTGVVMMFPTLRGGNTNGGGMEYLLGEVDDVLAAAQHVARLSYVDASQIYLGGHSTGGTLALLTAESSGRFSGVFAFGPVARVERYTPSLIPVAFHEYEEREAKLRSPIHWLHGIASPTWLIEGREPPGNSADVEEMCARSRNPLVHCILAEGSDHFSVLARVTRVIAARISVATEIEFALRQDEFTTDGTRR